MLVQYQHLSNKRKTETEITNLFPTLSDAGKVMPTRYGSHRGAA
jgi:hypothetical protein